MQYLEEHGEAVLLQAGAEVLQQPLAVERLLVHLGGLDADGLHAAVLHHVIAGKNGAAGGSGLINLR